MAAEQDAPVQARDKAFQFHLAVGSGHGERAYWQLTSAPELAEEGALGIDAAMRGDVVDRARELGRHLVTRPALDRQGTLAHLGKHRRGRQDLGDTPGKAETFEGGESDDDGACLGHLAEPRVDVSPELLETKVRPDPGQLRPSSRSSGCDVRSWTEIGEGAAHERIPRIGPLGHGDDREVIGARSRRQILGGMNGKVGTSLDQRLLNFGDESALAADRTDRAFPVQVAGRLDDDELGRDGDVASAGRRDDRVGHELGLAERERTATGRDPERQHVASRGRTGYEAPRRAFRRAASRPRP